MCIELLMGRSYIFSFAEIAAKLPCVSLSTVFILHVLFFFFHLIHKMIMAHLGFVVQSNLNYI